MGLLLVFRRTLLSLGLPMCGSGRIHFKLVMSPIKKKKSFSLLVAAINGCLCAYGPTNGVAVCGTTCGLQHDIRKGAREQFGGITQVGVCSLDTCDGEYGDKP